MLLAVNQTEKHGALPNGVGERVVEMFIFYIIYFWGVGKFGGLSGNMSYISIEYAVVINIK